MPSLYLNVKYNEAMINQISSEQWSPGALQQFVIEVVKSSSMVDKLPEISSLRALFKA